MSHIELPQVSVEEWESRKSKVESREEESRKSKVGSRKTSEAQRKARDTWNNKQAQIAIRVKPDVKSQFDEHCTLRGESLAAFIVRSCRNQIERDNLTSSIDLDKLLSD